MIDWRVEGREVVMGSEFTLAGSVLTSRREQEKHRGHHCINYSTKGTGQGNNLISKGKRKLLALSLVFIHSKYILPKHTRIHGCCLTSLEKKSVCLPESKLIIARLEAFRSTIKTKQ